MAWRDRKIMKYETCELCNELDTKTWRGQKIVGDYIKFQFIDEDNTITSWRCDIHSPATLDEESEGILPKGWHEIN